MNVCELCGHHELSHAYVTGTRTNNGRCLSPGCECTGEAGG